MSFQSVSKSLVQIPSLLGQNNLPPTPIKKEKKRKKLNQVIRMRCFDSNNVHSRLCAELSGSNPSTMVSNTKHMAKERCSHLILKTNTDNQLAPPAPLLLPMEDHFRINLFHSIPKGKGKVSPWECKEERDSKLCNGP